MRNGSQNVQEELTPSSTHPVGGKGLKTLAWGLQNCRNTALRPGPFSSVGILFSSKLHPCLEDNVGKLLFLCECPALYVARSCHFVRLVEGCNPEFYMGYVAVENSFVVVVVVVIIKVMLLIIMMKMMAMMIITDKIRL